MLRRLTHLILHGLRRSQPSDGLKLRRLNNNPIITGSMLPEGDGDNINGPSLIRVPDWVGTPIGRYYLYFAHHHGAYIRMAYADEIKGPWRILPGGALSLSAVPAVKGHIASPDVIVDHTNKQIRMYFHGPSIQEGRQRSFVAISKDGIEFAPLDTVLGNFYFRVFEFAGAWYAISKGGALHRSPCGLTPFALGGDTYPKAKPGPHRNYNKPGNIRHVAVQDTGDRLEVFFTRIGDKPERILRAWIDPRAEWTAWVMSAPEEVIRPGMAYEGSELPLKASRAGEAAAPENALRDPAIFVDTDGTVYLLYSVMGEKGIAIAEVSKLHRRDPPNIEVNPN
jgi:hypothetical protein